MSSNQGRGRPFHRRGPQNHGQRGHHHNNAESPPNNSNQQSSERVQTGGRGAPQIRSGHPNSRATGGSRQLSRGGHQGSQQNKEASNTKWDNNSQFPNNQPLLPNPTNFRGNRVATQYFHNPGGRSRPGPHLQQNRNNSAFVNISPSTNCPSYTPPSAKTKLFQYTAKACLDVFKSDLLSNIVDSYNQPSRKAPAPCVVPFSANSGGNNIGNEKAKTSRRRPRNKTQAQMRKYKSKNLWNKNKKNNSQPKLQTEKLLSFGRNEQSKTLLSSEDDDESETMSTISRCSSPGLSEDSDVDSEDSTVSSMVSHPESTAEWGSVSSSGGIGYHKEPQEETFISVYWDIENCPVPRNKSAVDIVKKIRETFYDGRTEESFSVACDTRKLSPLVDRELEECDVTVIHVSSESKNAADAKLQRYLMQFQFQHKNKGAAIVLISGDSDFSQFLCNMRYKCNIYVNLICNHMARKALKEAPQRCILFEDFLKDLPDRLGSESKKFIVIVPNLPTYVKSDAVKSWLNSKLKNVNCRMSITSETHAEIICPNEAIVKKVCELVDKGDMYGTVLSVQCETRSVESPKVDTMLQQSKSLLQLQISPLKTSTDKKCNNLLKDPDKNKKHENISRKGESEKQKKEKKSSTIQIANSALLSSTKEVTLYVFVTSKRGDVTYWKQEFTKMFGHDELTLQWYERNILGYFLVGFKSLSKAQKARKILEKTQRSDTDAPRFFKMVKEETVHDLTIDESHYLCDIATTKIEDQINVVNAKKSKYIAKFELTLKSLKSGSLMQSQKESLQQINKAIADKQNELNEQKVTFLNFTDSVCYKLKSLDTNMENIDVIDNIMKDYSHECVSFENGLPIYSKKYMILKKVKAHQVLIIEAETGSGKTTQICQYLWREGYGKKGMIICTQPRKIAAISIASHVSMQIGCSVGNVVGYYVGSSKKMTNETEILYVTDFTMLKMCMEDPTFQNISCIVIDEAHERTVYTDLLIGMIKSSLKIKPELRVIVTSATLKVNLFQNYFMLPNEAILSLPGRTFPIVDVWLPQSVSLGWDYFDKTISTAYDVLQEGPGDILAFLPTPVETEKAAEKFNGMVKQRNYQSKLLVYVLHGKVEPKEQQLVFRKTPKDTRKIVFATNCAETSITIPGIRYVIDSGMVKEAQYDIVRNMSVLAVGFVNKSSAEQRRGRAGRTESGKCYRLYSESNYQNDMADSMLPEILKVNLGQALLKLLLLGVDPMEFDYIEAPPKNALLTSMQQLIHLGAVKNHCLTEMGHQMAALPLEPRLCHLILKGFSLDLAYEAIVTASLATTSRNVFFRNNKNKDEADLKKIRFCQAESDFMTFLEIYREWSSIPKVDKSHWCVKNCINGRSMKLAQELVNELIHIFTREFNMKISTKYSTDMTSLETLHKVIFQSFSENLCIFSGHKKLGYLSLMSPESLFIHPSSSLNALGHGLPNFIVYDTILKTSQTFLLNVTAVNEPILEEAAAEGLVPHLPGLRDLPLKPFVFYGLGITTLKELFGVKGCQVNTLEKALKEITNSEYCTIDGNFDSGTLSIFGPQQFHPHIEHFFSSLIESLRSKFITKEMDICDVGGINKLSGVIGAGCRLSEFILPGEFRDVIVKPANSELSLVQSTFQEFGEIAFVGSYKNYKRVIFRTVESAKRAVASLKNDTTWLVTPGRSYVQRDQIAFFKVVVTLVRRPCVGRAFFSITPEENLDKLLMYMSRRGILYKGCRLSVTRSKKCSTDICIHNLPEKVSDLELRSFISGFLSEGTSLAKLIVDRTKPYPCNPAEQELVGNMVKTGFSTFTGANNLYVELKNPKPTDKDWKAIVFFDNPHDGQNATSVLKADPQLCSSLFKNGLIELNAILETTLFCSKEVFFAIKDQVEEALAFFKKSSHIGNKLDIDANYAEGGNRVYIKICSNNLGDITDAKKSIQGFIQGDSIDCNINPFLEQLFTGKAKNFFKKLQKDIPGVFIICNDRSKIISIFGGVTQYNSVKREINNYLDGLENKRSLEISLRSSTCQRSLLKEVIKKYDANLQGLCSTCKLSSAKVDVRRHILTVTGIETALAQCQETIADMFATLDEGGKQPSEIQEQCPVCTDEVSNPSHRLEYCGHNYCQVCLLFQLQNAQEFPVCCCVESCEKLIVIADIVWATKHVGTLQKVLYRASFDHFMKTTTRAKYCPTPDCSMIYRVASSEEDCKYNCPSCQNNICTMCGVPFHVGLTCRIYQGMQSDDNLSLKKWMKIDPENRKYCPSCSVPIEKNGGCLHVSCWKCQCHMCWRCMQTFDDGDKVYAHQSICRAMSP